MFKRNPFLNAVAIFLIALFVSCGNNGNSKTTTWKLGHNFTETHPVHKALVQFANDVEQGTQGRIKISIFPNAILGDDASMIEQLQGDVIQMMKVSTSFVEGFSPLYGIFSIPYLFESREQFFKAMNTDAVKKIYESSRPQGFVALTYFDSGSRSFYTKNKPILHPNDLKGLKIRVIPSPIFVKMIELMGGAATAMPFGEVYTAIQTGTVDGAENNVVSLVEMKHSEVAKQFSFDEHSMTPDVLIVNATAWDSLSEEDKAIILAAAERSTQTGIELWTQRTEEAMKEAEQQGVKFHYPDKAPFQQATASIIEDQMKDPAKAEIITAIREVK